MRVQFDLRPLAYLEQQRKKHSFNFVRLLAVLLLTIFLLTSVGYLAMAFFETRVLKSDIEMLENEVAEFDSSKAALTAEIARLRKQEAQYAQSLAIMQAEPSTIEVLNAIENSIEPGMRIKEIRFVPKEKKDKNGKVKEIAYSAMVDASAFTEDQIIALTDGLSGSGLFSAVAMPSTKKDEGTGQIEFNLTLGLRPFGQGLPPIESPEKGMNP